MTTQEVQAMMKGESSIQIAPSRVPVKLGTKKVHSRPTDRDIRYMRYYAKVLLMTGGEFVPAGLLLNDGNYLIPDKAVIGNAIARGWVKGLDAGLVFTEKGIDAIFS